MGAVWKHPRPSLRAEVVLGLLPKAFVKATHVFCITLNFETFCSFANTNT